MTLEIFEGEQGTPEWFAARMGIPTASEFSVVMASGKDGGTSVQRRSYMLRLAGEVLTGEPAPAGYRNADMDRGNDQEAEARALYVMTYGPVQQVGFIRNGQKGCSPDSLIGAKGGLEIKCAIPSVQIDRLLKAGAKPGWYPPEHAAQVQGNMWVTEREWWDVVSYCPKLPLLRVRVQRDEDYIAYLSNAVDGFNHELAKIVEQIRQYDAPPPVPGER